MSERMQWSEAEAVVRAYRAEHGASDDVDVAMLARALGTNVGEVRRLAGRKPRFVDRSGVISAGIAVAVAAIAFTIVGPNLLAKNPLLASLRPVPVPVQIHMLEATPASTMSLARRIYLTPRNIEVRMTQSGQATVEDREM